MADEDEEGVAKVDEEGVGKEDEEGVGKKDEEGQLLRIRGIETAECGGRRGEDRGPECRCG